MSHEQYREKQERVVTIVVAAPLDAQGIGDVHTKTWLATYPNEEYGITRADIEAKIESRPPVERWRKIIENTDETRRVWAAKEQEKIIGFLFAKRGESENVIQAIYVLPDAQAMGVGQKLMNTALEWLGQDKPVSLGVVKYNIQAISFYKKLGFEEDGDVPSSPAATLSNGKEMPEMRMIRRLKVHE